MNNDFWDGVNLALEPFHKRWGIPMWEFSRTLSLSAAGVATALILVLAQIKVEPLPLKVSMWCAAIALPLWIGFWQICESYVLWGDSVRSHYEKPGVVISLLLYFLANCFALFVAVAALIWNFLPSAAVGFLVISVAVIVAVGAVCNAITKVAIGR